MTTLPDLRERNGTTPSTVAFIEPPVPAPAIDHEAGLIPFVPDAVEPNFIDLVDISLAALKMKSPRYLSSIFGKPRSWRPPYREFSEFRIVNIWRWRRMWKYLLNVTIPSVPRKPPPFVPPFVEQFFYQPSVILHRPDHIGSYTNFPEESWFLVNGIMTNDAMAQMNAAFVAYLFHRPVTLIQNSTDSFFIDMAQCMVGKTWRQATEPAIKAFPVIYDALQNPHKKRVVVIAHSQGTIIASNVLKLLYMLVPPEAKTAAFAGREYAPPEFLYLDEERIRPQDFATLPLENLAKLEVYCFATCADELAYFDPLARELCPHIEHFGNEHDLVARLGMLSPRFDQPLPHIDGPRYVRREGWGHFLNAHYLYPIMDAQKSGRQQGGDGTATPFARLDAPSPELNYYPRLYRYINGGGRIGVD